MELEDITCCAGTEEDPQRPIEAPAPPKNFSILGASELLVLTEDKEVVPLHPAFSLGLLDVQGDVIDNDDLLRAARALRKPVQQSGELAEMRMDFAVVASEATLMSSINCSEDIEDAHTTPFTLNMIFGLTCSNLASLRRGRC